MILKRYNKVVNDKSTVTIIVSLAVLVVAATLYRRLDDKYFSEAYSELFQTPKMEHLALKGKG